MLIICLVASCLIVHVVSPVTAQAGYKPSVPQVIVKLFGNAYEESSYIETVTDPFTGEDYTITHQNYREADWTFEFTVKNQPFTPYTDADGRGHGLRYVVEIKNHNEGGQGWKACTAFGQYETQYTTTTHTVICKYNSYTLGYINSLPDGSKLDFRVKAEVVYGETYLMPDRLMPIPITEYVTVASSDWSDVHTITLSGKATSSTPPSHTATLPPVTSDDKGQPQSSEQTQPPNSSIFSNSFFLFGVGALFAGVIIVVVLVVLRRHIKTPTYSDNSTQTDAYAGS
jgi:hypothetical protein